MDTEKDGFPNVPKNALDSGYIAEIEAIIFRGNHNAVQEQFNFNLSYMHAEMSVNHKKIPKHRPTPTYVMMRHGLII